MKNWSRVCAGVVPVIFVAAACLGQKLNDWQMQNAQIGPDSPIEVRAGSSYQAQAVYPVADGPLLPLHADVTWAITPAIKGISIDAKSGKISVDAGVAHGATTTVHANVSQGQWHRKLEAKLFVYRTEENPLVGHWYIDEKVACGKTGEMKVREHSGTLGRAIEWTFQVDRQFWISKGMGIGGGTVTYGSYEYDLGKRQIKLLPKWPQDKTASSWKYAFADDGKKLLLQPLNPANEIGPDCSFVLHWR
jgi:hypothetical protein